MEDINKIYEEKKVLCEFLDILKLIIYSSIGIVIFFIPIKLNGQFLTIIYHISYKLQSDLGLFIEVCIVLYITLGCIKPIIKNNKKKDNGIYSYISLFSIFIILSIFYGKNELILLDNNIALLIYELILNISTVFPVSAIFITFLIDYGILEVVESYFHSFMKRNLNLSGKTIVNILVYLFTDCFFGMYMTNKLYTDGKIRESEACNIILNFSILSLPMILYTYKDLNIKSISLISVSMIILAITNLIMSRTYPINNKRKSYYKKTRYKETIYKKDKLENAVRKYLKNKTKTNIFKSMINNLGEAIYILMKLIPNLVIVLYLGQIILNSNLIEELANIILNPILSLLNIENKQALNTFNINAFYHVIIGIDSVDSHTQYSTKFLIAIISILNCTSISGNMIYIKNTNIKISNKEFLISYIQRISIIIISYSIMYYFYNMYIV